MRDYDAIAITDEIYEHIVYDGVEHVPMATLPGMGERTVTISALSKTYSVTGWRVGWAIAPAALMAAIRTVHDFLTVAAAAPLQVAGVTALELPASYYEEMVARMYLAAKPRDGARRAVTLPYEGVPFPGALSPNPSGGRPPPPPLTDDRSPSRSAG